MGSKERILREKAELKMKIMQAAADILIKEGYEKTTIRKVAQAIEYSPRTVYLYFKDKDTMLMEIIEMGFQSTLEKKKESKAETDYSKPFDFFNTHLRNIIYTAINSPNLYKAIVYLLQYKAYPPGKYQSMVSDELRKDILLFYHTLGINEEDVDVKTELIFAFLRGFNLMLINKMNELSEARIEIHIQYAINSIYKGILNLN